LEFSCPEKDNVVVSFIELGIAVIVVPNKLFNPSCLYNKSII